MNRNLWSRWCLAWTGSALLASGFLAAGILMPVSRAEDPAPAKDDSKPTAVAPKAVRVLPGAKQGYMQLPNQWSLRPAGTHVPVGDLPVQALVHPSGKYLAVLHAGYGAHELAILSTGKTPKIISRTTLPHAFYGIAWADEGKNLLVSGGEYATVQEYPFEAGFLAKPTVIQAAPEKSNFVTSGLAIDGDKLFVAGSWNHSVSMVSRKDPKDPQMIKLEQDTFPYGCLVDAKSDRVFVSQWGKSSLAVLDRKDGKVIGVWQTASHPTEMVLSPDGKRLFVSCANSTIVSVLDTKTGAQIESLSCSLYPGVPSGNTPSSLDISPDGELLFVTNSDNNNLAVFRVDEPGKSRSLGFIPTGWYPTSVRYHAGEKALYVTNGKGLGSKANVQGPNPLLKGRTPTEQYIGGLYTGTVSRIEMPTPEKMADYTRQAKLCSPLKSDGSPNGVRPKDNPIPAKVGDASPIKYCIYVIKENRTYDQVFGDEKKGNGDPNLCIFGEKVTPNHHKLAREYVLLDNIYVEGEVSADGHEWTMGAYATDYVEKAWPQSYRGSVLGKLSAYPAEGNRDSIARPAGGYLWDRCIEANVSYRSYGEWVTNPKKPGEPGKPNVKSLEGKIDPYYWGYDLEYPDVKRAERFLSELGRFEKEGDMPRMQVVRLPNDHTSGTRVGKPTPTAMVAENDLALGKLVEGISKSKFWKETAIFVIEDDAQNGSDHVDAHRAVALVISPYTRQGIVDSTMYSTSSMLRTMELILGLKPMSQFDAAATPMYNSFKAKGDNAPYIHEPARVDLTEVNKATAWGAKLSEEFNLAREDAADDLLFNEVIWRSVKGPNSPMPAPVRAAFFMGKVKTEKDADDD